MCARGVNKLERVTFRKAAVWLSGLWTGLGILLTFIDLVEKWPTLLHGADSLFYVLQKDVFFIGCITLIGYLVLFWGMVFGGFLGLIAIAVSARIFRETSSISWSIPSYFFGVGFLGGIGGIVFLGATNPAGFVAEFIDVESKNAVISVSLLGWSTVVVPLFYAIGFSETNSTLALPPSSGRFHAILSWLEDAYGFFWLECLVFSS